MQLTFQEKSLWVSLGSTLLIFGFYFYKAFTVLMDTQVDDHSLIGLFVGVAIIITSIQVLLQSTLAIRSQKEAARKPDERENLISLKATRISHYVLILGVWVAILSIYFQPSGMMLVNIILFFFVISEMIGYGVQLIHHRRGL